MKHRGSNNSAQRCARLDFLEGQSVSQHLELQRVLKESCAEEGWLDDEKFGAEDKPGPRESLVQQCAEFSAPFFKIFSDLGRSGVRARTTPFVG